MGVNRYRSHELILVSYVNRYKMIQTICIRELLARSCTLSTNIFKRFASIKPNNIVLLANPEAFDN
jgi:hypothetical protein